MNAVKKQESPRFKAKNQDHEGAAFTNTSVTRTENQNTCEWDGKEIQNRTLVGGINSGDFREHTLATTMEECMGQCCKEDDCDLSFMIDKDCYTVKCSRSDLCQTRKAKATSFIPRIAYKKKSNVLESKLM